MVTTTHYQVIHRFIADPREKRELSVLENDIVELLEEPAGDGWVKVRNVNTKEEGYVPADYIKEVGPRRRPSAIPPITTSSPPVLPAVPSLPPDSPLPSPTLGSGWRIPDWRHVPEYEGLVPITHRFPSSLSELFAELRTPERLFQEKFTKDLGRYVGSQWDTFPLPLQQAVDDAVTLASTWKTLKWGKPFADFANSYNRGRHFLSSSH